MVFQLDGCQETVNTFILKVSEGHKESVKAHNTVIVLLLVGYKSTYNHSNSGNNTKSLQSLQNWNINKLGCIHFTAVRIYSINFLTWYLHSAYTIFTSEHGDIRMSLVTPKLT